MKFKLKKQFPNPANLEGKITTHKIKSVTIIGDEVTIEIDDAEIQKKGILDTKVLKQALKDVVGGEWNDA